MEHSFSVPLLRRDLGLVIALLPLFLPLLVLTPTAPVQASGTIITNCSNDTDLQDTATVTGGLITFNCGGTHAPATITLSGELVPVSDTTLDGSNGGHTLVLDGGAGTRLIGIKGGTQVTMTHLILTRGAAVNGSCVYVLGAVLLDTVEIHHCAAGADSFGGALYVDAGGTATLKGTNVHDNSAGVSGGGLYNSDPSSTLYVTNSYFAHNTAGTDNGAVGDGGAVWNAGLTLVSGSTFFSNTTTVGYGGGLYNQGYLAVTGGSITQNTAPKYGGGVRNYAGTTYLTDVNVSGNQAGLGGGVASDGAGSQLYPSHSVFLGNQATSGGGALYHGGLVLHIQTSMFRNNAGGTIGGALDLNSPNSTNVDTSAFDGNSAQQGGAIFNSLSGRADIEQDTLSGNTAVYGAGFVNLGNATLSNDTLSGNAAGTYGGGLMGEFTSRTLLWNDTLAGNSAGTSGGALYVDDSAVVTATNTILAGSLHGGNCAGFSGAKIAASQYSLSDDVTCSLSGLVHNLDPNGRVLHLSALGNYGGPTLVHMPEHNSPAIDGVGGSNAPNQDQRGQSRPVNGGQGNGYDIGAVERQTADTDRAPWLWLPLARR